MVEDAKSLYTQKSIANTMGKKGKVAILAAALAIITIVVIVAVVMQRFYEKPVQPPATPPDNGQKQNLCTPQSREAAACIQLYQPVCGWFDPAQIQCIKYPCAQTFSNSCFACMDEKVQYWTEEECPK